MGHMVSLATTQSCHCSAKVIMRYTIDMSAFNKTLLTEKIGGWIGSTDHILQTLVYTIKFILLNLAFKSLSSVPNPPPQPCLVLFPMNGSQLLILKLNLDQDFSNSTLLIVGPE